MHYTFTDKLFQGTSRTLTSYLLAIGAVAAMILVKDWIAPLHSPQVPFLLFFSAVVFSAWTGGFGPGAFATLLAASAACFMFFPQGSDTTFDNAVQLGVFSTEGLLISILGALRNKVESDIRGQRKWFEVLLASIGDGVIVCDLQGKVVYMNNSAEALTGMERSDALGKPMESVFNVIDARTHQAVGNLALDVVRKRRNINHAPGALILKIADREVPIDDSVAPIRDEAGHLIGVVSIFRDTSVQKEAEARREAIVRSALDAILSIDLDGRIVDFNPAAEAMFGYSWTQAIGKEAAELIVPESTRQSHRDALMRSRWTSTAPFGGKRIEVDARRADGSTFPCELSVVRMQSAGKQIYTGFLRDLTDLKRAQKAERDSERRFRIMADSAPVLVWMAGADRRCDWFNKLWMEFTGRSMAQELGFGWTDGVHPDDLSTCIDTYTQAFDQRESFRTEYRIRHADGDYRWVLNHGVPRYTEDGVFLGYIGSCTDINDEKLFQQSLQDADRRKDEFLAILGHELRNPLAVIYSATQLLERRIEGDERLEWIADTMSTQVRNMVRLLNDLLDISRITRGMIELRMEECDLRAVLTSSVKATEGLFAAQHQRLDVEIGEGMDRVYVDPTRMEQVVTNLLSNAAKYSGEKSVISLRAMRSGETAKIAVRDDGIGMTAELLKRAFEPFTQAVSGAGGGLGVGLALVRQIVELHGGKVTASSAGLGQGSEFIVRLPIPSLYANKTPIAEDDVRLKHPKSAPERRILVVDDVVSAAVLLGELLGERGFEVRTAFDGVSALAVAREFHPDVVLLDIGMPGMNGYETARHLRAEHGDRMHLVALTGFGHADARVKTQEAGFEKHLLKGLQLDEMARELESF